MSNIFTFQASGSVVGFPLDPRKKYTVIHKGMDASFGVDVNPIFLAVGTATADGGLGANKYFLTPNEAVVIGPGENNLKYASNGSPCFGISSTVAEAEELAANTIS